MKAASLLKTRNNKIHLALAFDQSEWLKPCIQFNKRTEAEKKISTKMEKCCTN